MKDRILTNWTFTRVLYIIMGSIIIVQTAMDYQWIGVLFGAYFAAMGLFSFGCASGNCYGGKCKTDTNKRAKLTIKEVDFKEVSVK